MSRIIGHGLNNQSVGELQAIYPRGSMVDGSYSTSGGGQSGISISVDTASLAWLQFGRMVSSTHSKLGTIAGMIDPPWKATAPVGVTIYNLAYMLSLRTPDYQLVLTGTVYEIVAQVITLINAQQEIYLRMGDIAGRDIARTETLDQRSFWEQLTALVARAGKEMFLRPAIEDKTLIIYLDVKDRIGIETGFLLHDVDDPNGRANIQVVDCTVDGQITNRLIGVGSQSAASGRLQSGAQITQDSIDIFRLRSGVKQYQNVVDETTLLANTASDVAYMSWPRIIFRLNILDVEKTFENTRPGNSFILHVANCYLPGGIQGWRGIARLMAMAYDETSETVGATLEAFYYGHV